MPSGKQAKIRQIPTSAGDCSRIQSCKSSGKFGIMGPCDVMMIVWDKLVQAGFGERSMEQYRIDFSAMPWQAPAAGVRFKANERAGRKLRLVEFGKDFVEPDWCSKGHIGYVLEGQLEVNFGGRIVLFGPGDGIFVPPGEQHKHKGRAITEVVKLILVEDA